MKSIKVYLQYPWKFPDSPYYKYLVENPPEGIEYLSAKKQKGAITNKKLFLLSNFLKRNIRKAMNLFNLSIPNAHLSPKGNYDLIHCAHCLSKNKDKPWVADIEGIWQFYIGNKTESAKKKIKEILLRENCKKIIPWTQATAEEIIKEFPEIKDKVEVVYPAIPLNKNTKKTNKKIKILYATRYFWLKGGIIALEVCKKLLEKYDNKIKLIFISDVPNNIKEKYPELKIKDLISQNELFRLYSKSDIFFYPSFMDTFGFGQLEAMSFGVPIVTVNTKYTKSRKEIIENSKTGLIFDIEDETTEKILKQRRNLIIGGKEERIIKKLYENCCKLIENKNLREKMSKNCIEEVSGKFSIKERNEKLRKIYEEAIK
jgi:glycosyltransferase involved in cell wall biosynthesis